jgi:transposase
MSASTTSPAVLHLALELSVTSWLIAYRLPWSDKVRLQRVGGRQRGLADARLGSTGGRLPPGWALCTLASCFEAGRDGFWLHRLLTDNGVINHVVEPTSILVTSGARRAKTDRLDAQGLLRIFAAAFAGDREICHMVRTPSVAEEDDKRPHREREYLVQERVRVENRIAALLATQRVLKRPSLRTWASDLDVLRTGDGRPLPPYLRAELDCLRRRLLMTIEMIREKRRESRRWRLMTLRPTRP